MNELKLTPIDQIEDMADGVPVLAVEGTVKYAAELKSGTSTKGVAWNKQFFVLGSETAEIACSMWDAEGSEVSKGEILRIENTQNKKGVWSGMVKGSYQKDGKRNHTLEIRANQVKITAPGGGENNATLPSLGHAALIPPDPDWPEAPVKEPELPLPLSDSSGGVMETRKHLMQSANLLVLCIRATEKAVAPHQPVVAQTSEQFQSDVAKLFIEASSRRTTDGVHWWSYIDKMPTTPIK